jgi:hypothetical protein
VKNLAPDQTAGGANFLVSESNRWSTMVMMPCVTRPVDLPNRPTKRFNLPFVGGLLSFEEF